MIKQLVAKDIRSYLMAEPDSILLDVRTKEEWDNLVEHGSLDELRALLQQQMTEDVGIVKRNDRLEKALLNFKEMQEDVEEVWEVSRPTQELIELRNMIQVGILVTEAALEREENVGLHYKVE